MSPQKTPNTKQTQDSHIFFRSKDVQGFQAHVSQNEEISIHVRFSCSFFLENPDVAAIGAALGQAIPSWFIKVEEAREKLIANNNKTFLGELADDFIDI